MSAIVVIVAKEPVATQVKTRLCPQLSAAEAARIYTLFIQDMVEEMSGISTAAVVPADNSRSSVKLALAYTPRGAEAAFKSILPVPVMLFPQQGEDLGQRLAHIFERLCREGYDQVNIINSDSPDLPRSLISKAVALQEESQTDLVLGPCCDGGYYLVGLKNPVPELFEDIPWSTDHVLEKTLDRARTLGLAVSLLEQWYDIDTYQDLQQFLTRNEQRTDEGSGPGWRTLRYLRTNLKCEV
ncbi:MAG: TIGR04282 family arsenosugar biosynthesis glycosyltransferase [Syntrophobacteraceae bacterium]